VPTADKRIHFHSDVGRIIGVGNGDAGCLKVDNGGQRSICHGLAQVIVQTPRQAEKIVLSAESLGLQPASVTLDVDSSGPHPFVP